MFADFGVLNYWTYVVGAIFIILVPGPNTFFVLKTGVAHGIRGGYMAALAVFIGDAVLMFLSTRASRRSLKPRRYCLIWSAISGRFICFIWAGKCSTAR